jgi:hypothetical protein
MALTDTGNQGTKPGQKPFKLYDRDGLFLLVNPGESKLWCSRAIVSKAKNVSFHVAHSTVEIANNASQDGRLTFPVKIAPLKVS